MLGVGLIDDRSERAAPLVPCDSAGGPARRAARRIDRLPPPTCLGLITCSADRLPVQPSAHFDQQSASDEPSYDRLDRRTPIDFRI
jgi:hypothetical protein